MSNYYKYKFVSVQPYLARVKEDLKSYFDTGAIDDVMFPLWVEDCLKKLGKGSYEIQETLLFLEDYTAKLPPDFHSVKEAWVCTSTSPGTWRIPGAYYRKITTKASDDYKGELADSCDPCDPCPTLIDVVYKTTTDIILPSIRTTHLLVPGNISAKDKCGDNCLNLGATGTDTFDIRGNKFLTNFASGDVYLVYYSLSRDEEGTLMVPDNYRITDYIVKYIECKVMRQLFNQTTDETFNQMRYKYEKAEQDRDIAWVEAEIESRRKTLSERVQSIARVNNRLNRYNIR